MSLYTHPAPLLEQIAALKKALTELLPLAEFGALEQSPPYADEHLLKAAHAALAQATEAK